MLCVCTVYLLCVCYLCAFVSVCVCCVCCVHELYVCLLGVLCKYTSIRICMYVLCGKCVCYACVMFTPVSVVHVFYMKVSLCACDGRM